MAKKLPVLLAEGRSPRNHTWKKAKAREDKRDRIHLDDDAFSNPFIFYRLRLWIPSLHF